MKSIDNIVSSDLVNLKSLSDKFREYLMAVLEYDEEEAAFVVDMDFADPFLAPYIDNEYEGDVTVDGVEYEVYSGVSAFENVGMYLDDDLPAFEFYTMFEKATIKDDSLKAYKEAKRVYVLQEGKYELP